MTDEQNPDGNAEAAKWRRQLRDTEAERDALRERLDATHRAQIEATAADAFHDPTDLWSATSLDQMRGEDGLIDPEKAEQAMNGVLESKPHWRKPEPAPESNGFPEVHQGARSSAEPPAPSFGAQLQKTVRGGR
jgi:hypothetical protein